MVMSLTVKESENPAGNRPSSTSGTIPTSVDRSRPVDRVTASSKTEACGGPKPNVACYST